jgi:hypothetical protein
MKTLKNKIFAITIAMFFILSMTASIMLIPNANAHTPPLDIQLTAFINAAPNPAGIGQTVTVGFWLSCPPMTAGTIYGDRYQDMTIKLTKPDATTTTLGPFTSDNTGGTFTTYTPTETGNYTFQMFYPGQTLTGGKYGSTGLSAAAAAYLGDYIEPANSNVATLTVQSSPVGVIPSTQLPTAYWSRPINAENSNWYSIAGNWLGLGGSLTGTGGYGWYNASSNYNPYTLGPTTAHILWTIPEGFGGVIGGEFGGSEVTGSYWSARQYERMFQPIILQGILYYEIYPGSTQNPQGWTAVNLQTGQTLWTHTTPVSASGTQMILRCGQVLDYLSPNAYGARPYIWTFGTPAGVNAAPGTTTWNLCDASTGNYILSIVNGSALAGTLTEDAGGNLIGYYVNSTAGTQIINGVPVTTPTGGAVLECWNSTQCIIDGTNGPAGWEFYPYQNAQISWQLGVMWAVPLPTTLNGVAFSPNLAIDSLGSGVLFMVSEPSSPANGYSIGYEIEAGYSVNNGAQLWITNRTETAFAKIFGTGQNSYFLNGAGVFVEFNHATFTVNAYSAFTGKSVWTTVLPNANPYDSDDLSGYIAGNVIYVLGLGGDIYALSLANGNILWQQTTTAILGSSGENTPYGVWPIWPQGNAITIADGMLYLPIGHEYSQPLFHGANEICLNITNGQLIWNVLGFFVNGPEPISDGIMTAINAYDNQIYAFGIGPSKTTVSAPDVGVTTSTPITITGTVIDISAGAQQQAVAANFPNGLPCVSDASMTQFMETVYEQQPMPTNVTGVPVTLSVLDSNGNSRVIGTTTTDPSGLYSFIWKPDIPGNYTLTATFAGTQSYYGSSAQTAFYASPPGATAVPTTTPLTGLASNTTLMYGIVAIAIIIIIIGVVLAILVTRRRP